MGPEESGVPDNDWVPADDNPPNSTVHALPPISGKGKVIDCFYACNAEHMLYLIQDPGDHVACSQDSGQQCGGGCDRVLGLDTLPGGGWHRGLQLPLFDFGSNLCTEDILLL